MKSGAQMAAASLPPRNPSSRCIRVRVSPMLLVFSFIVFSTLISPSSTSKIPYSAHCSSLVFESTPTVPLAAPSAFFRLSSGYFAGGDRILGRDPNSTFLIPKSLSFLPRSLYKTQAPGTIKIAGSLVLRGGGFRLSNHRRGLRLRVSPRIPRSFTDVGHVSFDLDGFWSGSTGKLCMVGTGSGRSSEGIYLQLSAVFKLNYPNSSNILTSVVSGVVESVDDVGSFNYFDPVRVLLYAQKDYAFTRVTEAVDSCSAVQIEKELLGFESNYTCSHLSEILGQKFRLEYREDCKGHYCGPFDRELGFSPTFMGMSEVQCLENGMLRMYIAFSDKEKFGSGTKLEPGKSLVAEGIWDHGKKKLCLLGCRVLDVTSSLNQETVGDCNIGLSLWFPALLSIENMSMASGRIWSGRDKGDSKYFDMVSFGIVDRHMTFGAPGAKYTYTLMDRVKKYCVRDDARKVGERRYPNMMYIGDMRFSISLTNAEGKSAWGYANPFFVGENENLYSEFQMFPLQVPLLQEVNQKVLNVSYKIGYTFGNVSVYAYQATEISAEGTYDARAGKLCMVGCGRGDSYLDCEILINIQLAPLNPKKGEHLIGSIRSVRKKSDPLFFKPLEISSHGMYRTQAASTIWWMDIEIAFVLISLTLSCILIGVQLFHIKRNPDVLPSISITMLAILTLGHMIPLLLNFEALFFKNRSLQNILLRSGGWLQVNEVLVRVITMVAFLLQFYLLRLAWSSRSAYEDKNLFWDGERKTLLFCLPLYAVGGLFALLFHLRPSGTQQEGLSSLRSPQLSVWEDLMSYAGFILDNFLLPQFVLNIFRSSKDKPLAPSFYVGMTVVRALPHVYDLYRAWHFVPHLHSSYIYASPDGDFYSSVWDIIIPCEGAILIVLIYLQQRFGGAAILLQRIKEPGGYEMVPVASH